MARAVAMGQHVHAPWHCASCDTPCGSTSKHTTQRRSLTLILLLGQEWEVELSVPSRQGRVLDLKRVADVNGAAALLAQEAAQHACARARGTVCPSASGVVRDVD